MFDLKNLDNQTTKRQRLDFLLWALVLALFFDFLSWHTRLGLWFFVFTCLYLISFSALAYYTKNWHQKWALWLILPILIMAFSPTLYNNLYVKVVVPILVFFLSVVFSVLLTLKNPNKHRFFLRRIPFFNDLSLWFIAVSEASKDVFVFRGSRRSESLKKIFIGFLVALPFLFIFSFLFSRADAVFRAGFQNLLNIEIDIEIVARIIKILAVSVFFAGLSYLVFGEKHVLGFKEFAIAKLDSTVSTTILLLVDLLFAVFVFIQIKYLFGNSRFVLDNGLVYAEYARQGFFELLMATVVAGILLAVLYRSFISHHHERKILALLQAVLMLFVGVVAVSALQRMNLYQEAYGFSVDRLYAEWFIYFIMAVFLVWFFGLFVKAGFRSLFYVTLVVGLATLSIISLVNVDGLIARKNVDRYLNDGKELDVKYLVMHLSVDAIPEVKHVLTNNQNSASDTFVYKSGQTTQFNYIYRNERQIRRFLVGTHEDPSYYTSDDLRNGVGYDEIVAVLIEKEKADRSSWKSFNFILKKI